MLRWLLFPLFIPGLSDYIKSCYIARQTVADLLFKGKKKKSKHLKLKARKNILNKLGQEASWRLALPKQMSQRSLTQAISFTPKELLFNSKGLKSSHQSCSSQISVLWVCFMGKRSQIALSFTDRPQKGVRQRCHHGGCRMRDLPHRGRDLGLLLLFLAQEVMAVTGMPGAGFRVERSALSTPYFSLQDHNLFLEAPLCLHQHSSVCLQGWRKWKTPLSFWYDLLAYV